MLLKELNRILNESSAKRWFHLSYSWKGDVITVNPRKNRVDDATDPRDTEPFIAVCPSVAQCAVALGAWFDYGTVSIYEAQSETSPKPANWVFDFALTSEHRFYEPTVFKRVGQINLTKFADDGTVKIRTVFGVNDYPLLLKNIEKTLQDFRKVIPDDYV